MDLHNIWDRIRLFVLNLPKTLRETSIWFILSYLIPLLNIGIIWAMKGDEFQWSISILSIVIVTNASFYTSLYYLAFSSKKSRRTINTINVVAYVTTVVLFTVSIIEVEKSLTLFPISIYLWGAFVSFVIAFILGLISKYDEVEAESIARAKLSKEKTETKIGNQKVEL